MRVRSKGPMPITMPLGKLMKKPLNPRPRLGCKDLLSGNNLSIFNVDMLNPIDFPFLVELYGGFDIGVLFFGLIARVLRIHVAAELFDTLRKIESCDATWKGRRLCDGGIHYV